MARLKILPEQAIISGFKGTVDFYEYMGIPVARKWPRSPGKRRSPAVEAQWQTFQDAASLWFQLDQEIRDYYNQLASGTGMTGRDMFTRGYISGLFRYDHDVEEEMNLILFDSETLIVDWWDKNASIGWTDFDLAPSLPIGTTSAYLRAFIKCNIAPGFDDVEFYCRKKDSSINLPAVRWYYQRTGGIWCTNDIFVGVDENRKIEAKLVVPAGLTFVCARAHLLGYVR